MAKEKAQKSSTAEKNGSISSFFKQNSTTPSKPIKSQSSSTKARIKTASPEATRKRKGKDVSEVVKGKSIVKGEVDKGKGKAMEVLELSSDDDDDDDEIEIVEMASEPARKKIKPNDFPEYTTSSMPVKKPTPKEKEKEQEDDAIELEFGDAEEPGEEGEEDSQAMEFDHVPQEGEGEEEYEGGEEWDSRSEPQEGEPYDDGEDECEWGEEKMEVGEDEDGEDIIIQGCSKDLEEVEMGERCPVCQEDLETWTIKDRKIHVNECLDSTPASPAKANTSGNFFSRFLFRPSSATPAAATSSKASVKASTSSPKPPSASPQTKRPLSSLPSFAAPTASTSSSSSAATTKPSAPNAFTHLMSSHTLQTQWKAAEVSDKLRGRLPKGEKRTVPFYKWVDGLEITVDAFKYGKIEGCKGYFLSHAHSDHYQNLSKSWNGGPIYCSLTTANLIKLKLQVPDKWIKVLPMDKTVDVHGIKVTLIDANHCPGSVLFLFEGPHTDPSSPWTKTPKRIFRHLHCGDFRASPAHINHPALIGKKIDIVYLDTTYLDAKYCFPSQELVIQACAQLVKERVLEGDTGALGRVGGDEQKEQEKKMMGWLVKGKKEEDVDVKLEGDEKVGIKEEKKERLLVLIGTYSIGKERIVKGVAQALGTKIYADNHKRALFDAQDDPELHDLLTKDPLEAQVHVCSLRDINHDALSTYLSQYRKQGGGFTKCIGLRPTGWTYRPETKGDKMPTIAKILDRELMRKFSAAGMYPQRDSTSICMAYGVPYSEHSSFFELTCFALSLNLVRIIPTVNVHTATSRKKMQDWVNRWSQERKRRADAGLPRMVPPRNTNYW